MSNLLYVQDEKKIRDFFKNKEQPPRVAFSGDFHNDFESVAILRTPWAIIL